ncbi:hypothetical protein [Microbulbifer halophilus]
MSEYRRIRKLERWEKEADREALIGTRRLSFARPPAADARRGRRAG